MKINFLFAAFLAVTSTSCGGDDSPVTNPENEKPKPDDEIVKPIGEKIVVADFESDAGTPNFYRFGNKGNRKIDLSYKPRWVYSHNVKENPVKEGVNTSQFVLHYTSMEATLYGLKMRFKTPLKPDQLSNVQLKIYQPKNVIGKDTYKNLAPATKQQICVKLLSSYNPVNDYTQEPGVLLFKDAQEFTKENEWVTYTFKFDKELYPSDYSLLKDGVVGIGIIPTYQSNTTLAETGIYSCYIDDVVINAR